MGVLDVIDRSWPALNRAVGLHTFAYRATGGLIGRGVPGGKGQMLLLDHIGAKSGKRRTIPLFFVEVDGRGSDVAIIASKGGNPKNPAWLHNLRANPKTTVQIGREKREVRARETSGAERDGLFEAAAKIYPPYHDYAARTEREIPVVALERR